MTDCAVANRVEEPFSAVASRCWIPFAIGTSSTDEMHPHPSPLPGYRERGLRPLSPVMRPTARRRAFTLARRTADPLSPALSPAYREEGGAGRAPRRAKVPSRSCAPGFLSDLWESAGSDSPDSLSRY